MKSPNKKIPSKNYFYASLILFGSIFLVYYVFSWYQVKKEEKLMTSYLVSTNTINYEVTDLDSLTTALKETPSSYFVFISYTNDESVYNLEKSLKPLIDKYKINDIFYYLDITNIKDDESTLERINNLLNTNDIKNIPVLIYVDNKINNILQIDNLNNKTFEQLLKNNGFTKID